MGNWTGWKAVVGAVVIVSLIGFRVFNSTRSTGPRTFDSGTWTVEANQSYVSEVKASANSKLQFEITRTTPGNFAVFLLDAHNHAKVTAIPPHQPIAPGEINMLFKWEARRHPLQSKYRG